MKDSTLRILNDLINRYPKLSLSKSDINKAFEEMYKSYTNHGKLLICGNGGSASDAEHMVGELMKSFKLERPLDDEFIEKLKNERDYGYIVANLESTLPAISLTSGIALSTAFANDKDWDLVFAQQVYGYGNSNDVFFGISTSGESTNVLYAAETANAKGLVTIALTREGNTSLSKVCDITIGVPENETYKIQELHLPIYHALCLMLENEFFGV